MHGDFRLGNFLITDNGLQGVLDWELTHLGDPMEDLAWACSRIWRGQTDMPGLLEVFQDYYALIRKARARKGKKN